MSIEVEIKYTDHEYLSAQRERLEAMPNNRLYTLLSCFVFVGLVYVLNHNEVAYTWWGVTLIFLTGAYTLLSLFLEQIGPQINLLLARKTKLQNTYLFVIDQNVIRRSTESGTVEFTWKQLESVDFTKENITFNLKNKNGSMLIPKARLSDQQSEMLKVYAKNT